MARQTFQLAKGAYVPGTKWLLVEEIARGGMGVTWRVVKKPGIHGVMKMILPDLAASSSYVRRFLEEVEILTKLNHPNIVQVFDFDTLEDGTPFFVMERLEGKTLGAAMVRTKSGARVRKAFPARVAYEITRQICEALYRAHSLQPRGVIHRDLKPENVYIHNPTFGAEPVIKLLDFGVAAFEQAARESGPVGTPRYMAPEQLRCEEITPKADLYAMGLVLYEMLVGRGPFDDLANAARIEDRALALANAHLHEAPPPPSRFAPWIPQSVDTLVLSALDKSPDNRPISAYALSTKLFELQFVNDGTPREIVDANTTAPTLVRIAEDDDDDAPRSEPALSPRARPDVPNLPSDTVREDAPPAARQQQTLRLELPVSPFAQTAPSAHQPPSPQGEIDRGAATRFRNTVPQRRAPQHNTEPMSASVQRRAAEGPTSAPAARPAVPEATPLTSEVPSRAAKARGVRERETSEERPRRIRYYGLRAVALVVPLMVGMGLMNGFLRMRRAGIDAGAPEPAPAGLVTAASDRAAGETAAPALPPPTALPVLAPLPAASSVSSDTTLPASSASSAPTPTVAAPPSAARAKAPPKSPNARPAGPTATAAVDDGRDLLYVPPPAVRRP